MKNETPFLRRNQAQKNQQEMTSPSGTTSYLPPPPPPPKNSHTAGCSCEKTYLNPNNNPSPQPSLR